MRSLISVMATKWIRHVVAFVLVLTATALAVPSAEAMPMFARKYKTSCSTCHFAFPALNAAGRAFLANGYRFPNGDDASLRKDEPLSLGSEEQKRVFPNAIWPGDIPGGIPMALQLIGRYNYARPGPVKWNFEFPHELELFMAGTMGDHFSFFGEAEIENAGNEIDVAIPFWLQYDVVPGLHVRMGSVDAEPIRSAHRQTRNHYNTNNFRSRNGWRYRDENYGVELWGAFNGIGDRGGLTYHIGAANGQGPFVDPNPSKDVYGRVAYKIGGLGEAGGTGSKGSATSNFWIDNAVTVGAFTYRGKARAATGTIDEDFDIVGFTAEAGVDRLRLESVVMVMDSKIPGTADRKSKLGFLQGSVIAFPWLVPFTRYEWDDANTNVATVLPVKSLVWGASTLPYANIRFTGDYKTPLDALNKSRRNHAFTLQVAFGF